MLLVLNKIEYPPETEVGCGIVRRLCKNPGTVSSSDLVCLAMSNYFASGISLGNPPAGRVILTLNGVSPLCVRSLIQRNYRMGRYVYGASYKIEHSRLHHIIFIYISL